MSLPPPLPHASKAIGLLTFLVVYTTGNPGLLFSLGQMAP